MLKHNDNLENKEKVKYDLYKILRMSILLNPKEVDRLTLDKFKEASLNIDKMLGKVYEEKLEEMFYETTTLEEEENRLKDLVAFIKERLDKRKTLLEDYQSVTNRELEDVEYIEKSNDLYSYEDRLQTIKEYLDNSKLIEVNKQDLEVLKEQLVKEYDLKSSNELKNTKLEETLYNTFINALYEMDLYTSLELENVDEEIKNLQAEINETEEQKDTFITAFNNLKSAGISGDLEMEYSSYVENSKRNYYYVKEKEIILKLYKLIEDKVSDYSDLFKKREEIKELLRERHLLRKDLGIKDKDLILKVSDCISEQEQEIETEKENVDNINVLTERIKLKESRLEELKRLIKKPEILSILKEYSLIDTYNHEDVIDDADDEEEYEEVTSEEIDNEEEIEEENDDESAMSLLQELLSEDDEELEEETEEEFNFAEETEEEIKEYQPNQIKESLMVPSMNFGLSRLKSISVMKRVGDMLGVSIKKTPEPEPEPQPEPSEPVKEEIFITPEQPEVAPVSEKPIVEENKNDDLFWTPVEFSEMKNETEEKSDTLKEEDIFVNPTESVNENSMFEFKIPEVNEENKDSQIFETASSDNGLIFPEPVMPEIGQVLPENKEDKFMWPESAETFDINGIFPN